MKERAPANDVPFTPLDKLFEPTVPQGPELPAVDTLPVNVRELDDDTATILMVDSNLRQRETLLPSEKAWVYRMKLEAMKHQGYRSDLTSGQFIPKLKPAREGLADESGENYKQISQYIRMTELILV